MDKNSANIMIVIICLIVYVAILAGVFLKIYKTSKKQELMRKAKRNPIYKNQFDDLVLDKMPVKKPMNEMPPVITGPQKPIRKVEAILPESIPMEDAMKDITSFHGKKENDTVLFTQNEYYAANRKPYVQKSAEPKTDVKEEKPRKIKAETMVEVEYTRKKAPVEETKEPEVIETKEPQVPKMPETFLAETKLEETKADTFESTLTPETPETVEKEEEKPKDPYDLSLDYLMSDYQMTDCLSGSESTFEEPIFDDNPFDKE